MRKKVLFVLLFVISFLSFSSMVMASSVSIKASSTSVTKGNSITITSTISADSGIYTTEGTITCTGAGVSKSADMSFEDLNTASTSKSFSFTIKPTSSGTVTCSTSNVKIRELKEANRYALNNASVSITVKEPVYIPPKVYSGNNYLKSLSIDGYDISPVFNKDTTEYSSVVPNGTEKVKVNASVEDSTAKVSGTGEISVSEGVNKIEVKVTAENGNVKTYVINVTVKELDPIEVTIGKDKYNIIRKEGIIESPANYEKSSVKIKGEDVLCYKNSVTKNILIGLKDSTGNSKYYSYDEESNTYSMYYGYKIGNINIQVLDMPSDKVPSGYTKVTFEYNDTKLAGYQYIDNNVTYAADDSVKGNPFYLIYGVNELTGKESVYVFDKLENTIQRYNSNLTAIYEEKADSYFLYFLIAILLLALSIVVFSIILMKKKKHKSRFA